MLQQVATKNAENERKKNCNYDKMLPLLCRFIRGHSGSGGGAICEVINFNYHHHRWQHPLGRSNTIRQEKIFVFFGKDKNVLIDVHTSTDLVSILTNKCSTTQKKNVKRMVGFKLMVVY